MYSKISYDDLVVFALNDLVQAGKMPVFENLVVRCYELFPKRFSIPGYPMFPDSLQVNRCWVRCRTDKRLIEGSASKGFKLTLRGLQIVEKTARKLGMSAEELSETSKTKEDRLTKVETYIKHLENSTAYRIYHETGTCNQISDYEFASMLMCPLDAPKRVLKENLGILMDACKEIGREDLLIFLKQCKGSFGKLLREPGKEDFAGGMMKKRR